MADGKKPGTDGMRRAAEKLGGLRPEETAVIGDQIFTDVRGGNRFGALTILVRRWGRSLCRLSSSSVWQKNWCAGQKAAEVGGSMIRFGPAGAADSFAAMGYKKTAQMPEYLEKMGLTAFEYQCGRGVRITDEAAGHWERASGSGTSLCRCTRPIISPCPRWTRKSGWVACAIFLSRPGQ